MSATEPVPETQLVDGDFEVANVVPPLLDLDELRTRRVRGEDELPIVVPPFEQHVQRPTPVPDGLAFTRARQLDAYKAWDRKLPDGSGQVSAFIVDGDNAWVATENGLYLDTKRHNAYGVDGPLATRITALALDSKHTLWVGTPLGLSVRSTDGAWRALRGRDGLPYEDVTALAFDARDRLWIGTTRGAIQYRPYEEGRQWFYRAGRRYLPGDVVRDIALSADGQQVWFDMDAGVGCVAAETATLLAKAESIEERVNERHRRLGLVADCLLDDAANPTAHTIPDQDNDGLWTAYHVAAMSLCYGTTKDEAALRSVKESMHALYMLQNASGTPGLVARSVVPADIGKTKSEQWRPTADGTLYWKSDTSSDEIDGHYLAFYTYWEHVARHIPEERALCERQVRALTDYIVDNGYLLIDWTGKRTRWGFWSPELLNNHPEHYLENGLNSLQILSFLKVAHYITGDPKYKKHYDSLIVDHGYLNNVLLSKKTFPDSHNHSDDQLGYVAWYPILQLERDPRVHRALQAAVRRHYKIVEPERPSFFAYVTATIDPFYVDLDAAIENLRNIPEDRRSWRTENSHRTDVVFHPRVDRFDKPQLLRVLPADERTFGKWNRNPYIPDEGGDGRHEDDGAAYLLPYWMGRYHGFIAEVK
ncbi:MAG: hypothetical protein GY851_29270 [bacterium]|nr:hypothetical protein [bacterium]